MQGTYQTIDIGQGKSITLETGRLAKQASGSVVVRMGDTMVLCTVVLAPGVRPGQDFFPLSVDYREKYSAAGMIPGGFIKREGPPKQKEILSSRLIDRVIRPLFPDGFRNEVQIIAFVISADKENDADVLAGVGASAALMLANAPFAGPTGEVRVGRVNGELIINPTKSELAESDLNLVVAGTADAIVMVEGEMDEISEEEMVEALDFGHAVIKDICAAQHEFIGNAGTKEPFQYSVGSLPDGVFEKVDGIIGEKMAAHIRAPYEKQSFYGGIADLKEETLATLLGTTDADAGTERADATEEGFTAGDIKGAFGAVEKNVIREMAMADKLRLDGRGLTDIRHIWTEVDYLPRAHGSAVFTRGETQALVSVTLGNKKDALPKDEIFDQEDRSFFLHYMFPPFCTGEAKFLRGASRREVGHGTLAERALLWSVPSQEDFPYTIRVNSDVLESNGSSSMASVCGGSMAMMDAGVPLKKPIAGIAMGLISDGERFAVLSDILGTEDHLGDMDFKLTGTREGITACQMDIKIKGLKRDTLIEALHQARDGRIHILDKMAETIAEPKEELKDYAPRMTRLVIDAKQIGAVIGPGGKVIQGIQKDTGTSVNIEEADGKGYVTISSTSAEASNAAIEMVRLIVTLPEVGSDYEGTIRSIQDFGAFVEILPGKEGLLHISEIDYARVDKVSDYFQVGDKVKVKLLDVRKDGKLRLSRRPFLEKPEGWEDRPKREDRGGRSGGGRGRDDRRGGGGRGRRD